MRVAALALFLSFTLPLAAESGPSVSLTLVPAGVVRWRGEGKILPQGYTNRTENQDAPLYVLEWRQAPADRGYWGLSLWHTGVFGGGEFARESLPDVRPGTGGLYQRNLLNVGFTNFFATRYHPVADGPLTAEFSLSVVREIFKRKAFEVLQGSTGPLVSAGPLDDVNEISAEGIGFGLSGVHGKRLYARWRGAANYYVQFFDAKTDASAGQIFQAEAGLGWRPTPSTALEIGGLHQWWFTLGQGNRRLSVPGTDGAVITYNRQSTSYGGLYVRATVRFEARP
jgi:hypothetical protein